MLGPAPIQVISSTDAILERSPVCTAMTTNRTIGTLHGLSMNVPSSSLRRLVHDNGGAVVVEYTMLLIFVGLPLVAGLTAGGIMMLKEYRMARDLILLPVP